MSVQRKRKSPWGLIAVLAVVLLTGVAFCAYPGKPTGEGEKKQAADSKSDGQDTTPDAVKVPAKHVPDGTVDELAEFISNCQRRARRAIEGDDKHELISQLWTISAAADKLLAAEPELKHRGLATGAKIEVLSLLVKLRQRPALSELRKFCTALSKDKVAEFAALGRSRLLNADLLEVMTSEGEDVTASDAKHLGDSLLSYLKTEPEPDFDLAQKILHIIESSNDPAQAAPSYRKLAAVLEKLAGDEAAEQVEGFRKTAERVLLVGKPIEISGTLVDGSELDWNKFKGKVVLIDFWATWCGPCVEEIPNVLENYKRYHDKGFEVVGISADEDRNELESFLHDNEVPWPILFTDPGDSGRSNPMIEKFGVKSFPTVILVGQDGKVLGFNSRGEQLGRQLERLLGPAPDTDGPAKDGAETGGQ